MLVATRLVVAAAILCAAVAVFAPWGVARADQPSGDAVPADSASTSETAAEQALASSNSAPTVTPLAPAQDQQVASEPAPAASDPQVTDQPVDTGQVEPTTTPIPTATSTPEPTAQPSPTPEPGGPTDLRFSPGTLTTAEAVAGAETRFATEIEHQGTGLDDAKEIEIVAPTGWAVELFDHNGAPLTDQTGNGHRETAPLAPFQPQPLVVAVALPDDATAGSVATIELRASSTGNPSLVNEDRLSLSVHVLPKPSPSTSPDGGAESVTPDATATASVPATPDASVAAEPTPEERGDPILVTVSIAGGDSVASEPGRWVDVPHTVTTTVVPATATDVPVPIAIDVTSSEAWPVEIVEDAHVVRTTAGPYVPPTDAATKKLTTVAHNGVATKITVRVWIPEDAHDGATTSLIVVARPLALFDDAAGHGPSDAPDQLTAASEQGIAVVDQDAVPPIAPEMVGYDIPADPATARSVVTVERTASLNVRGNGLDFGTLSPLGTGANPGTNVEVGELGATYTRIEAVSIDVTSGSSWSIACSVTGEGLTTPTGTARLEWRVSGTVDWLPVSSSAGTCANGSGSGTVVLDVRYHVAWTDPPGPMSSVLSLELIPE